jgi:predicted PurR-regulated permease PerM
MATAPSPGTFPKGRLSFSEGLERWMTFCRFPTSGSTPLDVPDLAQADGSLDASLLVQAGLLLLGVLTLAYVAADIVLPIMLAFVLNLLFQPGMRALGKLHLPRAISALMIIISAFSAIIGIGAAIAGPGAKWAQKLPGGVARLEERLQFLTEPIYALQTFLHQFQEPARSGGAGALSTIEETLLKGTQHFASGFFETLLILFFLLVSGDTFLRKLVEVVPSFSDKRRVVALSQQIEENVSAYLLTITVMNALVGIATAAAAWACGLGDPILWGGIAFLLNYAPIIGPSIGVLMFVLAGLLTIENLWQAFLPAAAYLLIHLIEGETVTPILLARRFTLNPVIVIISLIFWFWMWGVPGAVLAVPMLAIAKIICDDVKPLNAIGHFLEG